MDKKKTRRASMTDLTDLPAVSVTKSLERLPLPGIIFKVLTDENNCYI